MLRGLPRTPPSGDNLGVLDYHLKRNLQHVPWASDISPLVTFRVGGKLPSHKERNILQ